MKRSKRLILLSILWLLAAPLAIFAQGGDDVPIKGLYRPPNGAFQIFEPVGWDLIPPNPNSETTQVAFTNADIGAVIAAYVGAASEESLADVPGIFTIEHMDAVWSNYDAWVETASGTCGDSYCAEYALRIGERSFVAKQIARAEGDLWLSVLRYVAPKEHANLIDSLDAAISPSFEVYPAKIPMTWEAAIREDMGFLMRHPPDWRSREAGAGWKISGEEADIFILPVELSFWRPSAGVLLEERLANRTTTREVTSVTEDTLQGYRRWIMEYTYFDRRADADFPAEAHYVLVGKEQAYEIDVKFGAADEAETDLAWRAARSFGLLVPPPDIAYAPPTPTPTALPTATPEPGERETAEVVRISDGDTIVVRLADGKEYRVRYIGIDTPETHHPDIGAEPFGYEASALNREYVKVGDTVILEKDITNTDQYGRLLRYIFTEDGVFVNAELLRAGLAQARNYEPDSKYADYFFALQQEAKAEGRGMWAGPTPEPTVEAKYETGMSVYLRDFDGGVANVPLLDDAGQGGPIAWFPTEYPVTIADTFFWDGEWWYWVDIRGFRGWVPEMALLMEIESERETEPLPDVDAYDERCLVKGEAVDLFSVPGAGTPVGEVEGGSCWTLSGLSFVPEGADDADRYPWWLWVDTHEVDGWVPATAFDLEYVEAP